MCFLQSFIASSYTSISIHYKNDSIHVSQTNWKKKRQILNRIERNINAHEKFNVQTHATISISTHILTQFVSLFFSNARTKYSFQFHIIADLPTEVSNRLNNRFQVKKNHTSLTITAYQWNISSFTLVSCRAFFFFFFSRFWSLSVWWIVCSVVFGLCRVTIPILSVYSRWFGEGMVEHWARCSTNSFYILVSVTLAKPRCSVLFWNSHVQIRTYLSLIFSFLFLHFI